MQTLLRCQCVVLLMRCCIRRVRHAEGAQSYPPVHRLGEAVIFGWGGSETSLHAKPGVHRFRSPREKFFGTHADKVRHVEIVGKNRYSGANVRA